VAQACKVKGCHTLQSGTDCRIMTAFINKIRTFSHKIAVVFFLLTVIYGVSVANNVNAQTYTGVVRPPFTFEAYDFDENKIISSKIECETDNEYPANKQSRKRLWKWATTTSQWLAYGDTTNGECALDYTGDNFVKKYHTVTGTNVAGVAPNYFRVKNEQDLPTGTYLYTVGANDLSDSVMKYTDFQYGYAFKIQNSTTTEISPDSIETSDIINIKDLYSTSYNTRILDNSISQTQTIEEIQDDDSAYEISNVIGNSYLLSYYCESPLELHLFDPDGIELTGDPCFDTLTDVTVDLETISSKSGTFTYLVIDSNLCSDLSTCEPLFSQYKMTFNRERTTHFVANYFIDTTEIVSTISEKNPTLINWSLSKRPTLTKESQSESINNLINGTSTATTSLVALSDGTYDLYVSFSNVGCVIGLSSCPFPLAYIYNYIIVTNGLVTFVGQNEIYNNLTPLSETVSYEDCSITEIGGCINNSIKYLFLPSQEKINEILLTKDALFTKIPFVYLSEINTVVDEVLNSEQTQSLDLTLNLGFGEITIISREMIEAVPFVNLLNQLISASLWLAFAIGMYRMALGIHNKETQTV